MEFLSIEDIAKLTEGAAKVRFKNNYDEICRLDAKETLTAEDQSDFDGLTAENDQLVRHIDSLVRTAELERQKALRDRLVTDEAEQVRQQAVRDGLSNGTIRLEGESAPLGDNSNPFTATGKRDRGPNPWDMSGVRVYGRNGSELASELRARAFTAIERADGMSHDSREHATMLVEKAGDDSRMARYTLATSNPDYTSAFYKAARGQEAQFTQAEHRAVQEMRAMSLTDTAGGYLAPFQLDPTVIITSDGTQSDIRKIARSVTSTQNVWHGVSAGATSWGWVAEGSAASDGTSTFAQPSITCYKAVGFVPISAEAEADELNVAQVVGDLIGQGRMDFEATALVTGSGSSQPKGVVTAIAAVADSKVTSATADTLALADVYALEDALPSRYRGRASFLANHSIYNKLRSFDTYGGAGLWVQLQQGVPSQLLGRPNYEAEAMADDPTTDSANVLLYGDFSNFVIADRIGVTIEFIPHLFDTSTGRPTGSRGWYAYYRIGSDVVNAGGLRLLQIKAA